MRRRTALSLAGTALATALAGCPGGGSDSDLDSYAPDSGDGGGGDGDGPGSDAGGADAGGGQSPVGNAFTAEGKSGFVAFGQETDSREEARSEGLLITEDRPIVIEGEPTGDGRWESTSVEFPDLRNDEGAAASVELPEGLRGELTADRMTAEGTIRITVALLNEVSFEFGIEATTEGSNALEGGANFDGRPPAATLVDNEFTVENGTGNPTVDRRVGIPAPEPGTNWFELELTFPGQ
jgi:hypothetical protein